jgi:hypothetical protein
MWFWIGLVVVLFVLLVVALFRSRRGWRPGSPDGDATAEGRMAAYLGRVARGSWGGRS